MKILYFFYSFFTKHFTRNIIDNDKGTNLLWPKKFKKSSCQCKNCQRFRALNPTPRTKFFIYIKNQLLLLPVGDS